MARGSDEHYSNLFRNEKRCKNERLFSFIPVVSISRFRNTVTVSVFYTHTHTRDLTHGHLLTQVLLLLLLDTPNI